MSVGLDLNPGHEQASEVPLKHQLSAASMTETSSTGSGVLKPRTSSSNSTESRVSASNSIDSRVSASNSTDSQASNSLSSATSTESESTNVLHRRSRTSPSRKLEETGSAVPGSVPGIDRPLADVVPVVPKRDPVRRKSPVPPVSRLEPAVSRSQNQITHPTLEEELDALPEDLRASILRRGTTHKGVWGPEGCLSIQDIADLEFELLSGDRPFGAFAPLAGAASLRAGENSAVVGEPSPADLLLSKIDPDEIFALVKSLKRARSIGSRGFTDKDLCRLEQMIESRICDLDNGKDSNRANGESECDSEGEEDITKSDWHRGSGYCADDLPAALLRQVSGG